MTRPRPTNRRPDGHHPGSRQLGAWDIAQRCPRRHRPNRRAAAIVFAIVCLAMAAVLTAVVARIAVLGWKSAQDEAHRAQAVWLVESALGRAGAQLAADPDYSGETWKIPADEFGGRRDAVVLIQVTASPQQPRQRTVRVRADYPDDPVDRVRKSRQLVVTLPPEETPPADEQNPKPPSP